MHGNTRDMHGTRDMGDGAYMGHVKSYEAVICVRLKLCGLTFWKLPRALKTSLVGRLSSTDNL